MTLKISELLNCKDGLDKLMAANLPAATSLKVIRLVERISSERETAQKQYFALFEKHGTSDGEKATVPQANWPAFQAELTPLLDTEITVHIDKIPFPAISELQMSSIELSGILPFLFIEEAAVASTPAKLEAVPSPAKRRKGA